MQCIVDLKPSLRWGHSQPGPGVAAFPRPCRSCQCAPHKQLHPGQAGRRTLPAPRAQLVPQAVEPDYPDEDRVKLVENDQQLQQCLKEAGPKKLVVLEIQSDRVCETGMDEPELQWEADKEAQRLTRMEACKRVQHTYHKIARECPDVIFLEMVVPDTPEGAALQARLGAPVLPTLQFFRDSKLLWQQQGYLGMEKDMESGVMYYSDTPSGALKDIVHVRELTTPEHFLEFVQQKDPSILVVVNVSVEMCSPCVKMYPAVLALAKNFVGHVSFGRVLGDTSDDMEQLMGQLNILEVPTFIFYRAGKEIGRHTGGSRGDLIGNILNYQLAAGYALPPPTVRSTNPLRNAPREEKKKAKVTATRQKRDPWR